MCTKDFVNICISNSTKNHFSNHDTSKYSEDELVKSFLKVLKAEYKMSIVEWNPSHNEYPRYMYLSGDKGILAYISFQYIESNEVYENKMGAQDTSTLIETLRVAYSQLDRPVFFLYFFNCKDRQGIFFETNEQIMNRLQSNMINERYYPVLDEMGDFNNLISIWKDLKKNSVRV